MTLSKYPPRAVAAHWISVLLLVALGVVGLVMGGASEAAARWLGVMHALLGGTLALVMVFRLVQRVRGPKVEPLPVSTAHRRLISTVHAAMLLVIVLLVASGVATSIGGDWSSFLFGGPPVDLASLPSRGVHATLVWVLAGLVVVHVAGVLLHERRAGGALSRMLPSGPESPESPTGP